MKPGFPPNELGRHEAGINVVLWPLHDVTAFAGNPSLSVGIMIWTF